VEELDDEPLELEVEVDVGELDDEVPELDSVEDVVELVSFFVDELEPLSLLSASRVEPNEPAERLSVL
jgi:hypothetical protein